MTREACRRGMKQCAVVTRTQDEGRQMVGGERSRRPSRNASGTTEAEPPKRAKSRDMQDRPLPAVIRGPQRCR